MGGALLQQVNHDTLKFALKCSAVDRNRKWHNVHKNPVTDPSKASKGGRFNLVHNGKEFVTVEVVDGEPLLPTNALDIVLEDGAEVRAILLPTTSTMTTHDLFLRPWCVGAWFRGRSCLSPTDIAR
jgi:nicotinic acid phosphoribosyltransferase